ncbi:NAD(P)/FAD-dependent oxidoreductase [Aquipuribacter nitratireducens]|uniref:NADH:ubiquinone reductase (non-electrogenic) n=1 Tax=Aquipuribacter nitratireducens TaxID=650104 RepID=A0ABW0GMX8_9MICO
MTTTARHHVVIVGSGFGGLFAAKRLARADVDVTLVSRTVHHLFQPLLYQVATGILSEGEIAPATREVLKRQGNVRVLLGDVLDVDLDARSVTFAGEGTTTTLSYDSLVVAAGAGQSYFGNEHFAEHAPGMKTVDDALELRARIFTAFERAELAATPEARDRALTFVVVGAGPTGVEMAGQIAELANRTLAGEYRSIATSTARIVLLDAADRVLPMFDERLSRDTADRLRRLGVDVRLGGLVTDIDASGLTVRSTRDGGERRIDAETVVWAAGVEANPLGRMIAERAGADTDRAGRVRVEPDTSVPGHPEVFVVGDLMALDGLPGVAQVAIQSGRHAAATIAARVAGRPEPGPFRYWDKGSMATISRFAAVAEVGRIRLTGFVAWVAWLFVHLLYLIGFKNRVTTLLHWAISFVGRGRTQRAVTRQQIVARTVLQRVEKERVGGTAADAHVSEEARRRA